MCVTVLFRCSLQTASLKRWTDCKTTCPVWVLLKDYGVTRRIGLGASVWTSKIVLDFAYTEQHEMQKQTLGLTTEKLNAVSPMRILHETVQEKLKLSWVSNVQRKKNELLLHRQRNFLDSVSAKTFGVRFRGVQTPLFVHLCYAVV